MKKSIVTEYDDICFICGRRSEGTHHLIFGTSGRELSDQDGLKVPVCNNCHSMGDARFRIHGNPIAEKMSKIIGQLAWEKEYITQDAIHHNAIDVDIGKPDKDKELEKRIARKCFISRYGRSYL